MMRLRLLLERMMLLRWLDADTSSSDEWVMSSITTVPALMVIWNGLSSN